MGVRIQVLPSNVANQIAAGEVIERPASVVKELLENALDAKATQLSIELSFGGLNAIVVSDNGEGIEADDLLLALTPHATSKMTCLSDLASIGTLGFRGEALASIASVSRLCIQSKPDHQAQAMQIKLEDDEVSVSPCARNAGTTVTVEDLFYNAPVRKRFLKSERTEFFAIDRLVRCFALSAPYVGVVFSHNGEVVFNIPKGETEHLRLLRIQKILGKAFLDAAIPLETHYAGLQISGWVGGSAYARSQQDRLWIYVNQRMVNDKLLNHAVKQAYEGVLHPGRYPGCLLYLDIDPAEVDVNVHPTKHELRFHDPRNVHDALRSAIGSVLSEPSPDTHKQEGSLKAPKQAQASQPKVKASTPTRWVVITHEFALLFLDEKPFLVDVQQLQQEMLFERLRNSPLPLEHRPLLVPVTIALSAESIVKLEQLFELFAQIGLTLSWLGEQVVVVRTIPILTPHLNLKPFVEAALKLNLKTVKDIYQLLAQHQCIAAFSATDLERETWVQYVQSCSPEKQNRMIRPLSSLMCKEMFRVCG